MYDRYDFSHGDFGQRRAVHSTWLGLLTEAGFPGLLILISLLGVGFAACRRVRRLASQRSDLEALGAYASAIEASLIVFVIGGSFLSAQYTEMTFHVLALTMVLNRVARERAAIAPDANAVRTSPSATQVTSTMPKVAPVLHRIVRFARVPQAGRSIRERHLRG
jgi:O-antigen ligase